MATPSSGGKGKRPSQSNPSTSQPSETGELKVVSVPDWVSGLYNINLLTDEDLKGIYEAFRYQGFDRMKVLSQLASMVGDYKIVSQMVILCALRGPKAAFSMKLLNGKGFSDYGISASNAKGTDKLTCQRITAATADLAAFYLKRLNVGKRIMDHPLPGWLQFPSAGSITLPKDLRDQHLDFARKFSPLIGGVFNEQIYAQMVQNAYLDPQLKVFE
jgi:hypothetical protein